MDRQPLEVSPTTRFLVSLVERRVSGNIALGERTLTLANGHVHDVSRAVGDPDFGDFLVRSGRLTEHELASARTQLGANADNDAQLGGHTRLQPSELRTLRRALWLDRFVRSLREQPAHAGLPSVAADSGTPPAANSGEPIKFLPLLLDALCRLALDGDAALVGTSLNHRLCWTGAALDAEAQRWACFGEGLERPVIAALLARLPASAPQVAALVRAGFVRLEAPGSAPARTHSRIDTLPPPPPSLSILSEEPPAPVARLPSTPPVRTDQPRAPRVQLDPGAAGVPVELIPHVERTAWPIAPQPLEDPLRTLELELANPNLASSERAHRYLALAELWSTRLGSLEESARCLREAAAADPEDPELTERAADSCLRLGQIELAARYASAAIAGSDNAEDRARRHTLLARIERAGGAINGCIQALSEAAAERPEDSGPHEAMAQLLADRDQLQLAAAHARHAATLYRAHDSQRALALYALAYSWNASDDLLTAEYADLLAEFGYPEAATAVVAATARNLSGVERRIALRVAARRAEAYKRRDLASELLIELFDSEPRDRELYFVLDASMDRPGVEPERAALLESMVAHCEKPDARLLVRAFDALSRIEGEQETSLRYLQRAHALDPAALSRPHAEQLARLDSLALARTRTSATKLNVELSEKLRERPDPSHEFELCVRLCALRVEQGDARAAVSACLHLLSLRPDHAMTIARLWRATTELNDWVLQREALTLLAKQRTGREQGRALATLAHQLEVQHEFDDAVSSAEAALTHDASAADAAMIALRHVHRLEPARAVALLKRAEGLLAAPPALLFALAEAGRAASDTEVQLEALRTLGRALPFLVPARMLMLETLLRGEDAASIAAQADALLTIGGGRELHEQVREAVERLVELGDHAAAATIAERLLSSQGHDDRVYADRACEIARAADEAWLLTVALERAVSLHTGKARAERLQLLAAQHAGTGDEVAELRARLRMLALPEGRDAALDPLAALFARHGDKNRLLTVLTLRLDATSDPDLRRGLLFDLASAAVAFDDDREAAALYMNTLFQESRDARDWLLFGLGGLFALGDATWATQAACAIAETLPDDVAGVIYLWLAHKAASSSGGSELALQLATTGARRYAGLGELLLLAERLTLATANKAAALALYAALIDAAMGQHGRRSLHYRAGRWLERAGVHDEALAHYERAFELAIGAGVAFRAIERVARSAQRLPALIAAHLTLANHSSDERTRASLLESATRISLLELDDPAATLQLLVDSDGLLPPGRLDAYVVEASARLAEHEPAQARTAVLRLCKARQARAEQLWDGEPKALMLLSLARLLLSALHDAPAALLPFKLVLHADLRTSLTNTTLASGLMDYARALDECDQPEDASEARSDARMLAADASAQPANLAASDFSDQADTTRTSLAGTDEVGLRKRAASGDTDALSKLVQLVAAVPERRDEAHALLSQLVRNAPERTWALRQLHDQALELGAQAEARISAQLLSLFEPSIAAPARVGFDADQLASEELVTLVRTERSAGLSQLLSLAWEQVRALPRFAPTPDPRALGERLDVLGPLPLSAAFARATLLLGPSPAALYARPGAVPEVAAVPTRPPSIVARTGQWEPAVLEFLIARSLVHCLPEHALLCTLPEAEGRELLTALLAGFGASQRSLTRTDKELAAELWQTVPVRTQQRLRELLQAHAAELDYTTLRAQSELSACRAGLFVASDAGRALVALKRADPELADCDLGTEAGFQRACTRSAGARDIVRTALSLPFVGLTAVTLGS